MRKLLFAVWLGFLPTCAFCEDSFEFHWNGDASASAGFGGEPNFLEQAKAGKLKGALSDARLLVDAGVDAHAHYTTSGAGYRLGVFADVSAHGRTSIPGYADPFGYAASSAQSSWSDRLQLVGEGSVPFDSLKLNWMVEGVFADSSVDQTNVPNFVQGSVAIEDRFTGENYVVADYYQAWDGIDTLTTTGSLPTVSGIVSLSTFLGSDQAATFDGTIRIEGATQGGTLNIHFGHTMGLDSITFPDGSTPESHGFAIVFDSGLPSPNSASLFPGDANGDDVVSFDDLNILLSNYGLPGDFTQGDFDFSGTVDFTDLNMLLTNYGRAVFVSSAVAPVPEPSTLALAAFGAFGLLIAARRRR